MDLSFPLPTADEATPLPALDLARLLAAPGERPAAGGETAVTSGCTASGEWLAPADGAFNAAMAARLADWRQE